jgi:hypothetical protein
MVDKKRLALCRTAEGKRRGGEIDPPEEALAEAFHHLLTQRNEV